MFCLGNRSKPSGGCRLEEVVFSWIDRIYFCLHSIFIGSYGLRLVPAESYASPQATVFFFGVLQLLRQARNRRELHSPAARLPQKLKKQIY